MKKRLLSPLLAAALAAAVALTAAALPAFADGGEETPITIGQSQEQQVECTCTALCTGDSVNADCPVCGAEGADLTACEGTAAARAAALAAPLADGDTVYVGGVALSGSTGSPAYATTDESGNVSTDGATAANYNIKWDGSTLTLKDAYITNAAHGDSYLHPVEGAAIGVANSSGDAELTIQLESGNTIEDVNLGIWVYSSATGDASLTITGDGNLTASGSVNEGILVQSNGGNATLSIKNAEVTTTSSSSDGVLVRAKDGSNASLTVNGGSLTATGSGVTFTGIKMQFGSSVSSTGTPTVTVSNNAIVRANGGIRDNSSADIQIGVGDNSSGGIVFDGNKGTVYGDVTLQEDLTIGEGESLTLDDGASLGTGNYTLTVNGGTLTGNVTGTVNYKVTGVKLNKNTTTIKVGGTETLTATVEPANATNKAVTWSSDNISVATVDANGLVTAVAEGSATITVTTEDGSKTASCTVTVTTATVPVTGVTLDPTSLTLDVNQTAPLTATITPSDATNQNVTWTSDNPSVATVSGGVVTAVAPGEATITATTADGGFAATCTVTVNKPVVPPQPSDPAPSQPEGGSSTGSSSAAPRQQGPVVHNVSNSSAYRKGEYEFWMKVRAKIVSSNPGEVIEVNAHDRDKMPNSVMQALAAKEDVTLRIRWNGGEEIVIPSAAALQEKMRMFYPLSYLAKFDFAQTPAKKVK